MKRFMGRRVVITATVVPIIAVLGYAWVDGGRQPLRDIERNLPIPGPRK